MKSLEGELWSNSFGMSTDLVRHPLYILAQQPSKQSIPPFNSLGRLSSERAISSIHKPYDRCKTPTSFPRSRHRARHTLRRADAIGPALRAHRLASPGPDPIPHLHNRAPPFARVIVMPSHPSSPAGKANSATPRHTAAAGMHIPAYGMTQPTVVPVLAARSRANDGCDHTLLSTTSPPFCRVTQEGSWWAVAPC